MGKNKILDKLGTLMKKLSIFETFSHIKLITETVSWKKKYKNYGRNMYLNIYIKNENEYETIKKTVEEHFLSVKKACFEVKFFTPGKKTKTWKKTKNSIFYE